MTSKQIEDRIRYFYDRNKIRILPKEIDFELSVYWSPGLGRYMDVEFTIGSIWIYAEKVNIFKINHNIHKKEAQIRKRIAKIAVRVRESIPEWREVKNG